MNRERITITIKRNLLKKLDSFIDGIEVKNRSHAVEFFLNKAFSSDLKTAVVLAGGKKSSYIFTPSSEGAFIEQIFLWFKKNGIVDVIISAGRFSPEIKKILGEGDRYGVKISYVANDAGTADVLRLLRNKITEPFLMMNGDVFSEIDLSEMLDFHKNNEAVCTIAITSVKEPSNFGNVILQGNKILEFVEKPRLGKEKSYIVNAGIYIMSPEVFNHLKPGFKSLERDLFPFLAKSGKMCGYNIQSKWILRDSINLKK